eukprot:516555_1
MGVLSAWSTTDDYFHISIKGSKFYDIGCFYIPNDNCICSSWLDTTFFVHGGDVTLQNNLFSYYPRCGFASFVSGQNILLQNNLFIINNPTTDNIATQRPHGLLTFFFDYSTTLIGNEFYNNNDINVAWLYYDTNAGFNCLFGNKMDNFAIRLSATNITSCFRPDLSVCLRNKNICVGDMYGKINKSIEIDLNRKSIFSGNNNIASIWIVDDLSGIALDNVQIENILIGIQHGTILLVDSYIVSEDFLTDIWYDVSVCNVMFNDRMNYNSKQIAKLLVKCNDDQSIRPYNITWDKSMNASSTHVTHFSPTRLRFFAKDNTYWPGSILYFDYSIADIFGNDIKNYITASQIFIVIENLNLSLLAGFLLDEYGECPLCNEGITVFGANLLDKFSNNYTISINLSYDYLLLETQYIYLKVIGCPIGFGATVNHYQCEKCPTDKYNLILNTTDECVPCNKNGRGVSQCDEYFDSLHTYYLYRYLWFLLVIPVIIVCCVGIYFNRQYGKDFVVKKSLVLIIGISQFNDKKLFLPGVPQNIVDLVILWREQYNYDVFVCNEDTFHSTKDEVQDFIDKYKEKLMSDMYGSVIVHVISHGLEDEFICSDGKTMKLDFICHELISTEEFSTIQSLIKVVFYHGCRGDSDWSVNHKATYQLQNHETSATVSSKNKHNLAVHPLRGCAHIIDKDNVDHCHDSNLVIISGNIAGRTMSDNGDFTKCICESFGNNLKRILKADFYTLIVEIGNKLEGKTTHSELCHISGTLRFTVRLEKYKCKVKPLTQPLCEKQSDIYPL